MNISNKEILFIRYKKGENHYSIIKLSDGEENIIVENIVFSGGKDNYPFMFYGHIETEKAMDIFISKNNKSNKEKDIGRGNMYWKYIFIE